MLEKQSETLFPYFVSLMEEANWEVDDIEHVIITDGPGSYTGVRIAMTVAKVFVHVSKFLYHVYLLCSYMLV